MPSNSANSRKVKGEFHCPYSGCIYNGSQKCFSGKKFLNQHIAKVHAEKKFFCEKCGKGFGLDWWRKHHEETCGMNWLCECGLKYSSRESLLTHVRRHSHSLPDHIHNPARMKRPKLSDKARGNPLVVLIQPVIQNIDHHRRNFQRILPKLPETISIARAATIKTVNNMENTSNIDSVFSDESPINHTSLIDNKSAAIPHSEILNPSQNSVSTQTSYELESIRFDYRLRENSVNQKHVSIATQTLNELEYFPKSRESRASQCNRRKSKSSTSVGNESTHTQTAESAVVKIKRKRSRRKSVAITTEPTSSMLPISRSNMNQSVWPNYKDLIYQNIDLPSSQSFRNTMSTQTNSYNNKELCDSQTITDEELFGNWAETVKILDYKNSMYKAPFEMSTDVPSADSFTELQDNVCNTLPEFDLFSTDSISKDSKLPEMTNSFTHTSTDNILENDNCPIFSLFTDCERSEADRKMDHPVLSDIHTQTIANSELGFNLLANMETQTTDDFALYDLLEFSDTETQTPWDDFPDIDNSPLPPDQFSIEIQTDFSSLNTELNPYPYEFFNGTYVQNMIDKEKLSVNIETQTQDRFTFPQLTNSESQTSALSFGTMNQKNDV